MARKKTEFKYGFFGPIKLEAHLGWPVEARLVCFYSSSFVQYLKENKK
jgi:hypothetical protein